MFTEFQIKMVISTKMFFYIFIISWKSFVKTEKQIFQENIDKLSHSVLNTMSTNEVNDILPEMIASFSIPERNSEKQVFFKSLPVKDEMPSKKSSVEQRTANPSVFNLAVMEPNVYLKNENEIVEAKKPLDSTETKRFHIPHYEFKQTLKHDSSRERHVSKDSAHLKSESRSTDLKRYFKDKRLEKHKSKNEGSQNDMQRLFEDERSLKTASSPPEIEWVYLDRRENTPLTHDDVSEDAIIESNDEASIYEDGTTQDYGEDIGEYGMISTGDAPTQNTRVRRQLQTIVGTSNNVQDLTPTNPYGVMTVTTMANNNNPPLTMQNTIINPDNNVMTLVPVERPQVVAPVLSTTGTERSTMPVITQERLETNQLSVDHNPMIIQPRDVAGTATKTINYMIQPQSQHAAVKLLPGGVSNTRSIVKLIQLPDKDDGPGLKTQSDDKNVLIKMANVPMEVLKETEKTEKKDTTRKNADVINDETLKNLQLKLTNIISQLEEKVNKKQKAKKKEKLKDQKIMRKEASGVSEKSVNLLKRKLAAVMAKFKSSGTTSKQSFTVGKEWSHLVNNMEQRKKSTKKNRKLNDENWPSLASQLLGKLNKALFKLNERKIAKSLEREAVMYFNFDDMASNHHIVIDKSGHFNDATLEKNSHVSSRIYGSCGKAVVLNSGDLRYVEKYFQDQPIKAISLAMWVRTNVTGFVRWFARDSSTASNEFNTRTQYPLVKKNVWTHLCGTYNSSTGVTRIYVDGKLQAEKVDVKKSGRVPADFTPAGIGCSFGDDNLIAVDEVYMFSRALQEREVQILYDDCDFNRMVLHYGFQKVNNTIVLDQSGLNNNAFLNEGAQILDNGCEKCGSCLDLSNGNNDAKLIINGNQLKHRPTKALSFSSWFNLNKTIGLHPLFVVTRDLISNNDILKLSVINGKLQWKGFDKEHGTIFDFETKQTVIPEGIWVHVLTTFNSFSGEAKIFVDGHQKALTQTTRHTPLAEDWGRIYVGGTDVGFVDELAMYNWELDKSEINYVMKYCPDHPKLVSFTVHVPLE